MEKQYDVVVIGGGPVGATASRIAARAGASVLLVEGSDPRVKKVSCTGLISLRALEAAGLMGNSGAEGAVGALEAAEVNFILKKIRGAYIHTPLGRKIELDGGEVKAVVIDRREFDRTLLREAEKAGVRVMLGCRAIGLDSDEGKLKVKHNGRQKIIRAKVFIGADGPRSRVAKWAGLPSPAKLLTAIQVIVSYKPDREDYVEVYLGRRIAPNFFGWCVPAANGLARVGLATDNPKLLKPLIDNLLSQKFSKKYTDIVAGLIPIGVSSKTCTNRIIIAGDAAGQVKPTSGGGIYTGVTCAKIAGEVGAKCALRGDTSAEALSEYEVRWRSLLYRELFFGFQVHRLLSYLSDRDIDRILRLFDSPAVLELFTKYGDIDYPSHLAKELFKRPGLWGKLLSVIPAKELLVSLFRIISGNLERK